MGRTISIVKGNEARLIVNLMQIMAGEESPAVMDVREIRNLRANLISTKTSQPTRIKVDVYNNNAVIVKIPVLECGTYALEITGERNLLRIAARELTIVKVVYTGDLADVPEMEIEGSKAWDINMTMILYSGEAFDVDETVTESGMNVPRTSAVAKSLLLYSESSQQIADELGEMYDSTTKATADAIAAKEEAERVTEECRTTFAADSEQRDADFNAAQTARQQTFEASESARQQAFEDNEQTRQANEDVRIANENHRIANESERVANEDSRKLEHSARIAEADNATETANSAAAAANKATANADNATIKANAAATLATERANDVSQAKNDAIIATGNAVKATLDALAARDTANTAADAANEAAALANLRAAEAKTATDNANLATNTANLAAENANEKAQVASDSADTANTAADAANEAATHIDAAVAEARDAVATVNSFMAAWSAQNQMAGLARPNGVSDPTGVTYGSKQVIREILKHIRMGTVKNGVVQHTAIPGRLTKATNGDIIPLDGSDGDVALFTDIDLHLLKATALQDDIETNVCAVGLMPSYWNGIGSKEIKPFALAPWGTVNAKIFDDVRSQAHTIYNTSVNGSYGASAAIFKQSYKTSGGGYPANSVSCVSSIQNAQNKNENTTDGQPYMSGYYEFYEILWTLMFAEMGTNAVSALNLLGCGCTPMDSVNSSTWNDETISGNCGWKIIKSDGTGLYDTISSSPVKVSTRATMLLNGINNQTYNFVSCGEQQRVLDAISEAGLVSYMNSKDNIFTYDEDGKMTVITDGSVNVDTGEGMAATKHYYVVRDVPGCYGMADGVMTAVVNSYTKMEFADGVVLSSDGSDLTGCITILKRSMPVYAGFAIPLCGYFVQSDGAFYIVDRNADDSIKQYIFKCAEKPSDIKGRAAFTYQTESGVECSLEKGLSKQIIMNSFGGGWIKKANYGMGLFCYTQNGGGSRTYESANLWIGGGSVGSRILYGSVLGCHVSNGHASVRSAYCLYHAGAGYTPYVGSWSVPNLNFNEN